MKIQTLPLIGSLLKKLDHDVGEVGLQEAMMNIVKRTSVKLIIKGNTKGVEDVLKNKPVIIVANHPFESEIVALIASMPSRRNAYLIVNGHFVGVSPNLDKHFIPVYIRHHVLDGKPKKLFGKILHKLHPTPIYDPDEEHRKNRESINDAIGKVKKGGLVIIFPGRRGKDGKWFSGVGHLIKGVGKESGAYVIKAHIQGTSDADYLRFVPFFSAFMSPVTVTFAEPIKVVDIYINNSKEIASELEEQYNNWTTSSIDRVGQK